MNPFNDFFNDGRPFALDACGDTMWDEVLDQFTNAQETALPKDQDDVQSTEQESASR